MDSYLRLKTKLIFLILDKAATASAAQVTAPAAPATDKAQKSVSAQAPAPVPVSGPQAQTQLTSKPSPGAAGTAGTAGAAGAAGTLMSKALAGFGAGAGAKKPAQPGPAAPEQHGQPSQGPDQATKINHLDKGSFW